jgi:hypothetical protein
MSANDPHRLERFVRQATRGLPDRSAPAGLASRVQAEIARRAALPWWRRSFAQWPLPARAIFVAASVAIACSGFTGFGWGTAPAALVQLKTTTAADLEWLRFVQTLLDAALNSASVVVGSIDPLWLYGGIAALVSLYVALFGLGAAAYRTLYLNR